MQCLAWNLNSKKQEIKPQALLAAEIKGNEIKFRNPIHMPAHQEDKATQKTPTRDEPHDPDQPQPLDSLPIHTTQRVESGWPSGPFTVRKLINELDSHRKDVTAVKKNVGALKLKRCPDCRSPHRLFIRIPCEHLPSWRALPVLRKIPIQFKKTQQRQNQNLNL